MAEHVDIDTKVVTEVGSSEPAARHSSRSGSDNGEKTESTRDLLRQIVQKELETALQELYLEDRWTKPVEDSEYSPPPYSGDRHISTQRRQEIPEAEVGRPWKPRDRGDDVRKLLRDLKGTEKGFDPRNETEFDDLSEQWIQQAGTLGHDPELMKLIFMRIGSRRVHDAISRTGVLKQPLQLFLDVLAKELFPYSQ